MLIIIPHIIITIFEIVLKKRDAHLQIQKYTLEKIVHGREANLMLEKILEIIQSAPNLDKIREENWKFMEIKLRMEILHQKIEKRIKEREKILKQYFQIKQRIQSNKQ